MGRKKVITDDYLKDFFSIMDRWFDNHENCSIRKFLNHINMTGGMYQSRCAKARKINIDIESTKQKVRRNIFFRDEEKRIQSCKSMCDNDIMGM